MALEKNSAMPLEKTFGGSCPKYQVGTLTEATPVCG